MKKYITILLVALSFNANGQIANYRNYQEQINKAELNVVRGNKEKALMQYVATLLSSDGNFAKDVHNALVLASELSETDTFFKLLALLQPKGFSNEYINSVQYFKQLHKDDRWQEFLNLNKDQTNIDFKLRTTMDSIANRDQLFRNKSGSYQVYGDTIKVIDSLNMDYLFELVSSDKLPGESKIGVQNFYGKQRYDIVFWHYTQSTSIDNNKHKITPIIVNAVLEGKILANKACYWMESQGGPFNAGVSGIVNFEIDGVISNYYCEDYDRRELILIDGWRKLLGMESLAEYYEKFKWFIENPESLYLFDMPKLTLELDRKTYERISSRLVEMK